MLTSEKSILSKRIALIVMLGSLYACGGGGDGSSESGVAASTVGSGASSVVSGSSSGTSSSGSGSGTASNNLPSFETSDNISIVEHQSDVATIEIDDADADDSFNFLENSMGRYPNELLRSGFLGSCRKICWTYQRRVLFRIQPIYASW